MIRRAALLVVLAIAACGKSSGPAGSTTTLAIKVTANHVPVGARVLLFDSAGQPLHMGNIDLYGKRQGAAACPIAPGVVGSWDGLIVSTGIADVPVGRDSCTPSPGIPYGVYKVWAWRGVEYERWEGTVDLSAGRGRVELAIPLERAWAPVGALAADLHVHARASNDSTVPNPQRVIAQVASGIQVVALSDHNTNGDLDADIAELDLETVIASIASNELTSDSIHLGVYPVIVDPNAPRGGALAEDIVKPASAAKLLELARALPNHPIVQVNHPRFRFNALFDGTNWNGVSWPPPFPLAFDAIEVLAGYSAFNVPTDRRFDDSARDFYTLIDHGHPFAPLGNSDTHDLNWVLDGTCRSYVFVDDTRTKPFDEAGFIAAIRNRRVVATSGPWIELAVSAIETPKTIAGPGQFLRATAGTAWVDITLAQAKFVHVDRIRITVGTPDGPTLLNTVDVPPNVRDFHWEGAIKVGPADTYIGVTADGDTALPLEQTGTYQKDKWNRAGVTPFAIASPVLIDADGDGRWKRGDADLPVP